VRRRKPVVVVGVVAAGLLVAGGIVATRAGAEETPQWPDVPGFSLSDLPGFSAFGDDSGRDSGDGAAADGSAADGSASGGGAAGGSAPDSGAADGGLADGGAAGSGDSGAGVSNTNDATSVRRKPVGPAPAVRGPAMVSQAGDDAADPGRSDSLRAAAAHAVPEKPDAPKAAAVDVKQRPALDRQDAGGSLVAAAKQNVTASDISESPSAPVQQQILSLINGNRREHGCGGVTLDRRLIEAANGHAADMARHDYFAHESRNGQGAGDRVTDAGYNWKHYGENIARGVDSPYEVVNGWMHSPEHRHNILDCTLDQMGVGLAISGDRTIYWVQDFATPM
jgi:uncharacterized protein YkwD